MSNQSHRSRRASRGAYRYIHARSAAVEPLEARRLLASGPYQFDAGQVTVEAEHYDAIDNRAAADFGGGWRRSTGGVGTSLQTAPDASPPAGDDFADVQPRVSYRVEIPAAGTYYVWVRGRADKADTGNSDSLSVASGDQTDSASAVTFFDAAFGWRNQTLAGPRATLAFDGPGEVTLDVYQRESGFVFDRLLLTSDPTFTPSGNGPAESARGGSAPGPAVVAGTLGDGDNADGPLEVCFDDSGDATVARVVPLPDGRFYVFGTDALGRTPYVLRQMPDGSLDAAFGQGGRRDLGESAGLALVPYDLADIEPVDGGGFTVRTGRTFYRFDDDLQLNPAFADGGRLLVNGFSEVDPAGGLLVKTWNKQTWQRFADNGTLADAAPVALPTNRTDGNGSPFVAEDAFRAAADGSAFVLFNSDNLHALVKLAPDLTVDSSYGDNGLAAFAGTDIPSRVSDFAVAPDGRVAAVESDDAEELSLNVLAPDGSIERENAGLYIGNFLRSEFSAERAIHFYDDGDVGVAYASSTSGGSPFPDGGGVGVTRVRDIARADDVGRGYDLLPLRLVQGADGVPGDFDSRGAAVAPEADGAFLVAGGRDGADGPALLYRLLPPPAPADYFGDGGQTLLQFDGFDYVQITGVFPAVAASDPAQSGDYYLTGVRGVTGLGEVSLRRGEDVAPPAQTERFIARINADGSLDGEFDAFFADSGDQTLTLGDGVRTPAELGWPAGGTVGRLLPIDFGYLAQYAVAGEPTQVIRFTPDLSVNVSYGDNGIAALGGNGLYDAAADGSALFADSPDGGPAFVERYDSAGLLVPGSRRTIPDLVGQDLAITTLNAAPDGGAFVTLEPYLTSDGNGKTFSLVKLSPTLDLDASFADGGVDRAEFSSIDFITSRNVFVGPDGRTAWHFSEDDGEATLLPVGRFGRGTAAVPSFGLDESPVPLAVGFQDDGGLALAFDYVTAPEATFYRNPADRFTGSSSGDNAFGLTRYDAGGTADTTFGDNGTLVFFDPDRPIFFNSALYVGNGRFLLVGADDRSTYTGAGLETRLTGFDLAGSVRFVDIDELVG